MKRLHESSVPAIIILDCSKANAPYPMATIAILATLSQLRRCRIHTHAEARTQAYTARFRFSLFANLFYYQFITHGLLSILVYEAFHFTSWKRSLITVAPLAADCISRFHEIERKMPLRCHLWFPASWERIDYWFLLEFSALWLPVSDFRKKIYEELENAS